MPDAPDFRATVRGDRLCLNHWTPELVGRGPTRSTTRRVRVALADLRFDEDELLVEPVPVARWTAAAEDVLAGWAAQVGFVRVWLPDRLVELGTVPESASARITCPTCGTRWSDDSIAFWEFVRAHHVFPGLCTVCGGALPEWQAGAAVARRPGVTGARRATPAP